MSQRTHSESAVTSPAVPPDPAEVPGLRGEWLSGIVLARSGPLVAVVVLVIALLAVVLVPFGGWQPWIVWPALVAAVLGGLWLVRRVPAAPAPLWCAPAVLAIAIGHGLWAGLTHAEHVVLRRDAGSYALYTQWISTRHGLPVSSWLEAFGGSAALTDPAFRLSSPAYYQVVHGAAGAAGTSVDIVPQFLIGAPAVYSLGWWAAGWNGLLVMPAICSALALLGFAGLVTRLVGARWAVLATAAFALAQPVLHAARSTYSEPVALILVVAAAGLLVDAVVAGNPVRAAVTGVPGAPGVPGGWGREDPGSARALALASGLAFGLACLVRVDGLREVSLLLPVAAVLALRRHPAARPLVVGALTGTAVAAVPALWLSLPYLGTIAASLIPLLVGGVVLGLGSLAVVRFARRREGRPTAAGTRFTGPLWRARWPRLLGAAVLLLGVFLASRPLWLTVRQDPNDSGSRVVAALQLVQGLKVDGGRTYAEHSLNWISWYLGPVMLVGAWLVFTALAAATARWWLDPVPAATAQAAGTPVGGSADQQIDQQADRSTDGAGEKPAPTAMAQESTQESTQESAQESAQEPAGRALGGVPSWLGPAVVAFGSTVLTLYRPGITPDHPWADRRMVTVVIPALVIAGTAAAAWLTRRAMRRWPATALVAVVAGVVAVMLVPPLMATLPVAVQHTEQGEVAAAEQVCAALGTDDVVIALDNRAANEWPQVIRGVCDRPSSSLDVADITDTEAVAAQVGPIAARISAAGNTPVLLAATVEGESVIEALGLEADRVVDLNTTEDQRYLTQVPDGEAELDVDVWLADASGVS